MEMITLHCAGIETKQQLHAALAEALSFPEWYGHNLDALYDCLRDLESAVHLQLADWDMLPDWKAAFRATLEDAENDNAAFFVSFA